MPKIHKLSQNPITPNIDVAMHVWAYVRIENPDSEDPSAKPPGQKV
jgi:hypothetical protein